MTKQQQQYFAKIERAMASIQVRSGYCLVDSESENMPHVVSTNEKLYSTHCTCKAAHKGLDCYHRIAVDRYFDNQRTAERKQGAFTLAVTHKIVIIPVARVVVFKVSNPLQDEIAEYLRDEAYTTRLNAQVNVESHHGTCGHLWMNEDEQCGTCRGGW